MKYITSEKLQSQACELLRKYDVFNVPVAIDVLAHRLGLTVEYAVLGDDVSGLLVLDNNSATIGVNNNHPLSRQRFTIGHEIGHYILHRNQENLFIDTKYNTIFRDTNSSTGSDRMEIQANIFASTLLMPKLLLEVEIENQELDLGNDFALNTLAEKFQVSVQALVYRLSSLKFFERQQALI